LQPIAIIDRGRGPELAGTRITVFDVLPYLQKGWHHTYIAAIFSISSAEVLALSRYIEDHEAEVLATNARILARIAQGNSPEVEAMRQRSHARLLALRAELQQKRLQEVNGARDPG
jgi:uncharacterized protein (DUF433 family)